MSLNPQLKRYTDGRIKTVGIGFWQSWTPELAYILGFAYADGGIGEGRNSLSLYQDTPELFEKIQRVVGQGKLTFSKAGVWVLRFCEPALSSILVDYGIIPNKTTFGYWPKTMPNEFRANYIRGFFDGDGTIAQRSRGSGSVGFVCHSRSYLERLEAELCDLSLTHRNLVADRGNFRLRYSSHSDVKQLYELFYSSQPSLFMDRKRTKFDEVIRSIENSTPARGERQHSARLTEQQVLDIRAESAKGIPRNVLAKRYGIGKTTASKIINRITWRHI